MSRFIQYSILTSEYILIDFEVLFTGELRLRFPFVEDKADEANLGQEPKVD